MLHLPSTATRQDGVVTSRQLLEHGWSQVTIATQLSRGVIRRRQRGVYTFAGWEPSWSQDLWMAVLGVGSHAVVFRRSAGRLWGLDGVEDALGSGAGPDTVELAVVHPRQSRDRRVHRLTCVVGTDIDVHKGFRVTTVARTLLDLGAVAGADVVERAFESALRRRVVSVGQLRHTVEQSHVRRQPGIAVLRAVLDGRAPNAPPTESDAETRFAQLVRHSGLPEPERQVRLMTESGLIRVDFAWRRRRLIAEIDGAQTHAGPAALGRDLRRQNRLVLGWLVVRFTWEDIVRYPDYVTRTLRESWALLLAGEVHPAF